MKVAVLGCGPAGLVAAHAAAQAGAEVGVFSKRRKSELFGAQYLHEPIPGIEPGVPLDIRYRLMGTEDEYRRKVYGLAWDGPVSPGSLPPGHKAYDIRHTYDRLWDRYGYSVIAMHVLGGWLMQCIREFDVVLSTIPLPQLCVSRHDFRYQAIWAIGDAPARGQRVARPIGIREGDVICNGHPSPSWYRASLIFGHATLEWSPSESAFATGLASRVLKPLSNDCVCWPEVVRLGRYGKWQKGVLVHEAYQEVTECLASR